MKKLFIQLADNNSKREKGLMFCKSLSKNSGMLFKFPYAHHLRFWMKNTYIPLDIAFINDDGKILQIENMSPLSTRAVTSSYPCKYALEVNGGWFKKEYINVGDYIGGEAINKPIKHTAQVVKKPKEDNDDVTKRTDNSKKERKEKDKLGEGGELEESQEEPLGTPSDNMPDEMDVEGDYPEYPQSIYTVPYGEEEGKNPEIEILRDMRGRIGVAEDHSLEMEILYLTKRGHQLPPRRVRQIPGEGYPIKNGPTGELVVAFDTSPTISGAGWSIKGMQPKSFLLDNIIYIQLFDPNGKQLTDEQIGRLKNGETIQQVIQVKQQEPKKGFWQTLKEKFSR